MRSGLCLRNSGGLRLAVVCRRPAHLPRLIEKEYLDRRAARGPLVPIYRTTLPRPDLIAERWALPSRRRWREPKVGRVGLRVRGTSQAWATTS